MKQLLFLMSLMATVCHGQYTYWTYNGSDVAVSGYITSLNARLGDTVFHTLGASYDNGQRVYTATHSLQTGERLSTQSSGYHDFNYVGGSGYLPLSYHFLSDGGYLVLRAAVVNGWEYPDYIRLDANLDTLWTSKPRVFEDDPLGASYKNLPMFALPLWDGSYFSVLNTRIAIPGGNFYRFIRHDSETGEIISDGLWDEDEIDFDGSIYAVSLYEGVQTEQDSVLILGSYARSAPFQDPYQTFIGKFDLQGELGNFQLMDLGSTWATDGRGASLLEGDTLNYLYFNGDSLEHPFEVVSLRQWCTLRFMRINSANLTVIDEAVIPIPFTQVPLGSQGVGRLIRSQDNGYLAVFSTDDSAEQGQSVKYIVIKLDHDLNLEWYRVIQENVISWYTFSLIESNDGSIIVGGGLFPTYWDIQYDYFIKLDACGYMVPSDCPEFVSVADGEIRREGFRLWPNPGTGAVDAIVPFNARQLQVVDASGRCVYTEDLYYPRQTWQLTHLPNGVYTFIVHTEDGRKHHQRWVKQ